ncbi:MAG: recombinase family protein [Roseobacter sp.]|uniref:recombinase family protein n=1 Tax=Tateyamaria sp. TaxID=1929288 RepID=UPI003271D3E1
MSGQCIGYARVSTNEQDLSIQQEALKAAGCQKVFEEKISGNTRSGRQALVSALEYMRGGDTLVVTRLDRLARSMSDLLSIVSELKDKGVQLKATEQPVDTSSAAGKAFLQMLGVFSEFETNLRKERQMEGILKAKAAGKYRGRSQSIDRDAVRRLRETERLGPTEIARRLGIARASVYRLLEEDKKACP